MTPMRNKTVAGAAKKHSLFWTTYALIVLGVAVLGMIFGLIFGYAIDLPRVEELQQMRPNVVTYVYADDGRVLGQFATEKRVLVTFDQIPEIAKNAVLAAEDSQFFKHSGIDFRAATRAVTRTIFLGEQKGFSTLT